MGERAAETVKEIEEVRDRLGDEIDELGSRLPDPARAAKRGAGILLGGGALGAALWLGIRARRRRSRTPVQRATQKVLEVVPDRWTETAQRAVRDLDRDQVKRWAAIGAGAWLVLRLAELRQLRRVNRALLAR